MQSSDLQYFPLSPLYFSALVGLVVLLLLLIQLGAIRYAYMRLGVSSGAALTLLLGSLAGSYFNLPIAQIPGEQVLSGREVYFFGMRYVVPVVVQWPGTMVAVNVGGAIIPSVMSAYLLLKHQLWATGSAAIAIVAIACYLMAQPVPRHRDRPADLRPRSRDRHRRGAAVARARGAARLHRRQPRHADRS